jgi:hypothetical protein
MTARTADLVGGRMVVGGDARTRHGAGATTWQRTAVTHVAHNFRVYGFQGFAKRPIMPPTWGYTRPLLQAGWTSAASKVSLPEPIRPANTPKGHR